ncbi:MAG TPA: hypothetical protein VGQ76_24030 [Thermoanaerobaculia bacterium]|nr:hypothetical protein [Thermoanaerobaculia bacterium]
MRPNRFHDLLYVLAATWALSGVAAEVQGEARKDAVADAIVIVDTSTSMREPGMDPERASLLVTKLFADIVPGDIAVIRLLDVDSDKNIIRSRPTGQSGPCQEDPTRTCYRVEPSSDWEADARSGKLGSLARPTRGDAPYKQSLEKHLTQNVSNSMFYLAFRAAQGIFDDHRKDVSRPRDLPRTVIWLSDGRSEGPDGVRRSIQELVADGVSVEAIVFGRGDTQLATAAGLRPRRASTPGEIMKAFAGSFRRIVQAPYEIDNVVSIQPAFDMKANVDEAWIVVYGDDSLGDVSIQGLSTTVPANYAVDRWPGAGAYKVAYFKRPAAGRWTVHASGGGPGVAYAVVQRSALAPVLLEPKQAISGAQVRLVAGVSAGSPGTIITDPEVLRDLTMTADFQGHQVALQDRGARPDVAAGDGRFSATATFRGSGKVPIRLRIRSPLVDRTIDTTVNVSGSFRYTGPPINVDLGTLSAGSESCRQLVFQAEHEGGVPFALERSRRIPSGHKLEIRLHSTRLAEDGKPVTVNRGDRLEVCLSTTTTAPSSRASGEPWLNLHVASSEAPEHRIIVQLRWKVQGLSFWQRWRWLILSILILLIVLFFIGAYVLPQRFQGGLAVVFVPERDELDEQSPQPVRQWKGVGIGFYRNAAAFLHPDYRMSGEAQGALASLHAEKGGTNVRPGRGLSLHRETLESDWEAVPAQGRRARGGDIYRIGDRGPYFRIATRGRT